MLNLDVARTLAIVREMAHGKILTLSDGHRIGMGEDMTIGYMAKYPDGKEFISGLATMDLAQLNDLLEKEGIGMPIPDPR
ncbi:MAG: hypothetical protein GY832_20165 [Chloroflexi bacterium]|nr:hypothetical protein [Chloroflexota bacterium]